MSAPRPVRAPGVVWRWWGDEVIVLAPRCAPLVLGGAAALVWAGTEPDADDVAAQATAAEARVALVDAGLLLEGRP